METNNLVDMGISHENTCNITLDWTDPALANIIRIRLVSDVGCPFWDVSYVLGIDTEGRQVRVRVPFYQLRKHQAISGMVAAAKADRVYLKGLCGGLSILDVISYSQ